MQTKTIRVVLGAAVCAAVLLLGAQGPAPVGASVRKGQRQADADHDGLSNLMEKQLGTDPRRADTDGDGLSDGQEVKATGTDPLNADSDDDQLTDGQELAMGTDPTVADSDGDGLTDGQEVAAGTDPTNPDTDNDGVIDSQDSDPTGSGDPSCVAGQTGGCDDDQSGTDEQGETESGNDGD